MLVFTHGRLRSPRSTAFLASSPAPTITDGFDVLVQLVMAAMTTAPWSSSTSSPSIDTATPDVGCATVDRNDSFTL